MLEHIVNSNSNFLVVVPDTTHLGSNLEEVVRTIIEIEATGCKVICEDDNLPDPLQNALDSLGPAGVSKARSERIKDSMRKRAMLGKGLGKPPFGYRNGEDGMLEVVEVEASTVRAIYDKYINEGLGLRLIAQYLNEHNIKTRRGGRWNMVTIRDILRNPTYTGTYYRFGLRLPKVHEAIISPQLFRRAQDQTKARRPSSRSVNTEPFLLSGLAFCGYCGNKMMGVTRRQSWRRKDGNSARGVYRYYQCQSRNNQSLCGYHTWRAPVLESTVLSQLHDNLDDSRGEAVSNGAPQQVNAKVQEIWDKRIKNAERRFLLNLKRAARGEFGLGAVRDHLRQLDNARTSATTWDRHWDVQDTIANWDTFSFEEQQAFLLLHISKIVVHDDSVEVLS
jgi:DNA invertase Pin-like site-specific DNA recombinase